MTKAVVAALAVAVLGITASPAGADPSPMHEKAMGRIDGISACARMVYGEDGADCTTPTYCQPRKHRHHKHGARKHGHRRHCLPTSVRSES